MVSPLRGERAISALKHLDLIEGTPLTDQPAEAEQSKLLAAVAKAPSIRPPTAAGCSPSSASCADVVAVRGGVRRGDCAAIELELRRVARVARAEPRGVLAGAVAQTPRTLCLRRRPFRSTRGASVDPVRRRREARFPGDRRRRERRRSVTQLALALQKRAAATPDAVVIVRFAYLTPESSTASRLLRSVVIRSAPRTRDGGGVSTPSPAGRIARGGGPSGRRRRKLARPAHRLRRALQ